MPLSTEVSAYEQRRLNNLADNKRILAQLGLTAQLFLPFKVIHKPVKRKSDNRLWKPSKKERLSLSEENAANFGSIRSGPARRSSRIQGKEAPNRKESVDQALDELDDDDSPRQSRVPSNRPNFYGPVPGIEVGTFWETRMEACAAGVQRPTVAGIHGGPDGAYSIALSGGYADDLDMGEMFTYTGEGGRDLKGTKNNPKNLRTAPQSKDQTLTRGNLALSKNVETGNPVRVIRGFKLKSQFAPASGYRYDGLYTVEKAWFTTGVEGFGVWKFALTRMKDQAPPPWELKTKDESESDVCSTQDSGLGSEGEHSDDITNSDLGLDAEKTSNSSEIGLDEARQVHNTPESNEEKSD